MCGESWLAIKDRYATSNNLIFHMLVKLACRDICQIWLHVYFNGAMYCCISAFKSEMEILVKLYAMSIYIWWLHFAFVLLCLRTQVKCNYYSLKLSWHHNVHVCDIQAAEVRATSEQ